MAHSGDIRSGWFAPLALLLLLLHGAFVVADPAGWLADPGVGWHLKSGQLLVETRHLPAGDLFSHALPGRSWINYQWAFQVVLGLLEKAGGLPLVVSVCSLLYLVPVLWTLHRMLRSGAGPGVCFALALMVWAVMMLHTYARPHLFTYLFFAVYLDLLDRHARSARADGWKYLVPLPLLMIPWCNLHGGFTSGLALLGWYAGCAALRCVRHADADARTRAFRLGVVFGLVLLASLANPYGFGLHLHILGFLFGSAGRRTHEFLPTWQILSASVVVFWVLAVLGLGTALRRFREIPASDLVAGGFFLLYGISAVRHVVLFALLVAPVLARVWSGGRSVLPLPRMVPVFGGRACLWVGVVAAAVWVLMPWWTGSRWPSDLVGLNLGPASARVLDNRAADLVPVFNSDRLGGALVHRYYPTVRVFMDDRTDYYDGRFIDQVYQVVHRAEPGWRAILDHYRVRGVVLRRGSALGRVLRGDLEWRLLAEDPQSEIFERNRPAP